MSTPDPSVPVHHPDQLVIAPVANQSNYLGNAAVVHSFVGTFADRVLGDYNAYLTGQLPAAESQTFNITSVEDAGMF